MNMDRFFSNFLAIVEGKKFASLCGFTRTTASFVLSLTGKVLVPGAFLVVVVFQYFRFYQKLERPDEPVSKVFQERNSNFTQEENLYMASVISGNLHRKKTINHLKLQDLIPHLKNFTMVERPKSKFDAENSDYS
eukprot:TRINITY_DN1467_c0_g1_i1.p1 TRINITY_DN1467_c0_g1~~TRINITY_DN1467_c0_g1_i1.p1  ORF type:complete len:135 (+),score=22.22 TRINITY_DN1467_c0_g1_i1:22-426(+)